jgi:hypothetical protein
MGSIAADDLRAEHPAGGTSNMATPSKIPMNNRASLNADPEHFKNKYNER